MTSIGSKLIDRKCNVLREVLLPVNSVFLPVWTRVLDLQGCWMDPQETAGAGVQTLGMVGVRGRKDHHYFSLGREDGSAGE